MPAFDINIVLANGITTLAIFISGLLLKYTVFKDKESEGVKWLISGGLLFLIYFTVPLGALAATISEISESAMLLLPVFVIIMAIGYIFVIIGSIKLIIELLT
jgi:hypothetical protein